MKPTLIEITTDPILIKWHLGLGDAIICAPIVAKLAKEIPATYILSCYPHNLKSVQSMFIGFDNIQVKVIESVEQYSAEYSPLCLGYYGKELRRKGECFISWFYRQSGMSLSERDKHCPIARAAELIDQIPGTRMFIHDKPEHPITRGDTGPYHTRPRAATSILQHARAIMTAKEVHCIDSAFLHLADALPTQGKLFFHRYARAGEHNKNLQLRKNWEILE